jgi:hypothetical protein
VPRDGDHRDAQDDDQQEPEQEARTGAIRRDRGQEHRKQQRHGGRGKPGLLKGHAHHATGRVPACERQRRVGRHGKDEKDAHAERQVAVPEELDDPAPLVKRSQYQRQHRQQRPLLTNRHPGQPDVQEQQVGEERDRAVLSRGEQRRRRESPGQAKDGDEDRLAPDRQQHRDGRDQDQQTEGRRRWNQAPQRVGREERREENGDGRGIERVRRHAILLCRAQLAHDEKRDGDDDADRDAHRRSEPASIERVAEEEDRREDECDAGDRREEFHAHQLFPVERDPGR